MKLLIAVVAALLPCFAAALPKAPRLHLLSRSGYNTPLAFNGRGQVLLSTEMASTLTFYLERYTPGIGWERINSTSDGFVAMGDTGTVVQSGPSLAQPGNTAVFRVDVGVHEELLNVPTLVGLALGRQGQLVVCTPTLLLTRAVDGTVSTIALPEGVSATELALLGNGTAVVHYVTQDLTKHYLAVQDGSITLLANSVLDGEADIAAAWSDSVLFSRFENYYYRLYQSDLRHAAHSYRKINADLVTGTESGYTVTKSDNGPGIVFPDGTQRDLACLFPNYKRVFLHTEDSYELLPNGRGQVILQVRNIDHQDEPGRLAILDLAHASRENYCTQISVKMNKECSSGTIQPGTTCQAWISVRDSHLHPIAFRQAVVIDMNVWQGDADGGWLPGPYSIAASARPNKKGGALLMFRPKGGTRGFSIVAPFGDPKWRAATSDFTLAMGNNP